MLSPRSWDIDNIFKFMVFIGPISSIFDYATYGMMLYVFDAWTNPALVPNRMVCGIASHADTHHPHHPHGEDPLHREPCQPGFDDHHGDHLRHRHGMPFTWVGAALGFVPLPWLYWPLVATLLLGYASLTHLVKSWFVRRWGL